MNDFITGLEAYEEEAKLVAHLDLHLPSVNSIYSAHTQYEYEKGSNIAYPRSYKLLWKRYADKFDLNNCVIVSLYNTSYIVEVYGYKQGHWVYEKYLKR